ncbi:MAG TPA: DUF3616 domain-containing protein [Verrucomicrobiales bacterium]|nr:DUF3616 domain-containing protein [Verrucomicrobiales bacterium]
MKSPFFPAAIFAGACICLTSCEPKPGENGGSGVPAAAAPPSGWKISVLPAAWRLTGFQEDKDLSGIAAWDAGHCLICTDEGRTIQPGTMDRNAGTITAGAPISLLPALGGKKEADAEGVAVSKQDSCYYVTGSHGVGKKKGDFQDSRCQVTRIPVDRATGEPMAEGVKNASLIGWVRSNSVLGKYAGQPLQTNGFNIEGLTMKGGKLWFGVRGPNENGDAFVIETDPQSLFSGNPEAALHRLKVGATQGIREIAALNNGFLILTGNACAEASKEIPKSLAPPHDQTFRFFFWNPAGNPSLTFVGDLPSPSAKAEGMLVLEDAAGHIDVLVIFDGASGGGPKVYRLSKS